MNPIDVFIVNRPHPEPPIWCDRRGWRYYHDDLACWLADKAEALLSGVRE